MKDEEEEKVSAEPAGDTAEPTAAEPTAAKDDMNLDINADKKPRTVNIDERPALLRYDHHC